MARTRGGKPRNVIFTSRSQLMVDRALQQLRKESVENDIEKSEPNQTTPPMQLLVQNVDSEAQQKPVFEPSSSQFSSQNEPETERNVGAPRPTIDLVGCSWMTDEELIENDAKLQVKWVNGEGDSESEMPIDDDAVVPPIPTSDTVSQDNEDHDMEQLPVMDGVGEQGNNDVTSNIVGAGGRRLPKAPQKRVSRKLFREQGVEYTTRKGLVVPARTVKPGCGDNCKGRCHSKFFESDRQLMNTHFWNLPSVQKKEFVLKHIQKNNKGRTTTVSGSKRQFTRKYYLPKGNSKEEVCRSFFVTTLDVGAKFLRYTEEHSTLGSARSESRGKAGPTNKTPPRTKKIIKNYIENLPTVPSHYCRGRTTKKYLPQEYESLSNLYRLYKLHCASENYLPASELVFRKIFKSEYNIGIHCPKKDKCNLCVKFAAQDEHTQEEERLKEQHDQEKDAINKKYAEDQARAAANSSFECTSFDLQKVLNTPSGKSILFFYARKYAVFNLTFYESSTRNGFCYVWGESDGKRGSNEICSIMEMYLNQLDARKTTKEVALYCDNCAGQQKNKAMLTTIAYFLERSETIEKVSLNFLLAGHSMMTADSMHAVIERSVRNKTIYAPSEWPTIIGNARVSPFPYYVSKLSFAHWKDWKSLSDKKPISKRNGDGSKFKVSSVQKVELYKSSLFDGSFKVYHSAREEGTTAQFCDKRSRRALPLHPKQLYSSELPIPMKKYKDLTTLCTKEAIPQQYHAEYFRMKNQPNIRDELIETDEED